MIIVKYITRYRNLIMIIAKEEYGWSVMILALPK